MLGGRALGDLAARLRAGRGLAAKRDIAAVAARLALSSELGRRRSATTARQFRTATDSCCSPSKAS